MTISQVSERCGIVVSLKSVPPTDRQRMLLEEPWRTQFTPSLPSQGDGCSIRIIHVGSPSPTDQTAENHGIEEVSISGNCTLGGRQRIREFAGSLDLVSGKGWIELTQE